MKFSISVLVVGLVICPLINAAPEGTTTPITETAHPVTEATVHEPSPFRAESKSAVEDEDEDEETGFDLSDIMSLFGGPQEESAHVKRSSSDYYVDMDMAAASPKEHQYQWKTAAPKTSGANKKSSSSNSGQFRAGNGKVYTLHIVTDGEQLGGGGFGNGQSSRNYHGSNSNNNNNGGPSRVRSARSKIHVIPVTMRSNGKSAGHNHHNNNGNNGGKRIVKRFRGTRPDDHHIRYDSQSHSEEVQDIILPAESEIVDTRYENQKFEIVGPKELSSNDLKLGGEGSEQESQYLDHDPYDPIQEKIKVKHHHHHHHHNHVKTVIKKVPQPYPVEKIVHVPVEKVVHVPKPYPVDKFVEKIVHVPVERVIQVPKPVPVDRIVEKVIHVPKPYPVDRIVEKPVPVNRPVRVNVPYPVEKIVHVPKPYPVEKIVEKLVHVPKPYPVIKHVHVPVPVEKKVPYPVKVEVEKKVPYPVKVYVPKPYPVEKKVPVDVEAPPKKNSYRTNFEKHRMPGALSYQHIHQGHQTQFPSSSGRDQSQQQQLHQQQQQFQGQAQFENSFTGPMTTGMDYSAMAQQQTQQQPYPYQFEQSPQEMQYSMMGAGQQPTGSESEQQDYVFNSSGSEQQQQQEAGQMVSDSVDAASSDSVVKVGAVGADAFQINVPETTQGTQPSQEEQLQQQQFAESKTVSHLLQITPFTSDPKTLAYTRPVDQFVVFHTGTGFTVPK